jgi:two-component system OmpR family response regulator
MPRVLVVEDETQVRELVIDVLEDAGFTAVGAENGAHALELLPNVEPDLITLDLRMPVMGGAEFLRRIREAGLSTPVLVLSAYGAHEAATAIGGTAALPKPFDIDELITQVRGLLART